MCCNRGHYPKDVGLWQTDPTASHHHEGSLVRGSKSSCFKDQDHLHIVLPPTRKQTGCVCTFADSYIVVISWKDFLHSSVGGWTRLRLRGGEYIGWAPKIRDLLAVMVSEGGECSKGLVKKTVDDWLASTGGKAPEVVYEYSPDMPKDFALVKQEVPEWHEWLVMQAEKEAKDKRHGVRL